MAASKRPTVTRKTKPTLRENTPGSADVDAASACKAFSVLLKDPSNSSSRQAVLDTSGKLLAGTAQAQADHQPAPKWAQLGGDLITTAADISTGNAELITKDGNKAADECDRIPDAAKIAGGYTS